MRGRPIGTPYRHAAGVALLATILAGCSPAAVGTQVSNAASTGVAAATQVGPTAAALATSVADAQQTAAALATAAPGRVGSTVAGAQPTAAALATSASGAQQTAVALATAVPGNVPLRVGQFAAKAGGGTGGVQVIATPGGTGVVLLGDDFSVTGGTRRAVYLTREASPGSRVEVERGFIDLGPLRSATGQDVYPVPPGTDLSAFAGIVIYDTEAQVPLLAAPLARP